MAQSREERKAKILKSRKARQEVKKPVQLPDGTTTLKSFYGQTKQEAEAKWRIYTGSQPEEGDPEKYAKLVEPSTVAWWFFNKYWPLKSHLRNNSVDAVQLAARHLLPEIGDMPIKNLTATTLAVALDRIAKKQTLRNKGAKPKLVKRPSGQVDLVPPVPIYRPLANSTVNKCRKLGLELNVLAYEEDAAKLIMSRRVRPRKESPKQIEVYSPAMMRVLLEASRGSSVFPIVILCGFLGIPLNEAIGTQTSDLKPGGLLTIRTQDDEGELTDDLKTDYRARDLYLPEGLVKEIQPFSFGSGRLAKAKISQTEREAGIVDKPLSDDRVRESLRTKERRAGLHLLTPHELRHSFSSWLENNGCPSVVRLAILGQSRHAVKDRYNHADPMKIREWIGKFWEASFEPLENYELRPEAPIRGGARSPAKGSRNGRAVLTEDTVEKIVRPRLAIGHSAYAIAKDLKVDPKAIVQIRDGKTWTRSKSVDK